MGLLHQVQRKEIVKLKIEDVILLAAFLNKHNPGGEVELVVDPSKRSMVAFKFSTTVGDLRTVHLYDVGSYLVPKIISEDTLRVGK